MANGKFHRQNLQEKPRAPNPVDGYQSNFCRNPECQNFRIPVMQGVRKRGRQPKESKQDPNYRVGASGKGKTHYHCLSCGESFSAKSNSGIIAEYKRIRRYLVLDEPSCQMKTCSNYQLGLYSNPKRYHRFGKTEAGSTRYQCVVCKSTFSVKKTTVRQTDTFKNGMLFKLLMNKMPLRRISEVLDMDLKKIYRRIDFFHEQCQAFVAERERRLLNGKIKLKRLYLSTDRQVYHVNWKDKKSRKHVKLRGVGTADNTSGYVFPLTVNYDPVDTAIRLVESRLNRDEEKDPAFRWNAHYWMPYDYENAVAQRKPSRKGKRETIVEQQFRRRYESFIRIIGELEAKMEHRFEPSDLAELFSSQGLSDDEVYAMKVAFSQIDGAEELTVYREVKARYKHIVERDDAEVSEEITNEVQFPEKGFQVHEEYTQFGHFMFLAELFQHVEKVRFYLDQESGIRAAFLIAFGDRVIKREADAWFVTYLKDLHIDAKRAAVRKAKQRVRDLMANHSGLSEKQAEIELVKDEIKKCESIGPWGDRWVTHPIAKLYEPEKMMCWLTDLGGYSDDHKARLYLKASVHGIDRFFMSARRRLSMIERPLKTASAAGRTWYGYSPYNPEMIQKLMDVFRVYYNYCLAGEDKATPAMRLGLARGPVPIDNILHFEKHTP